ncbi:hypothetical protein ACCO45_010714 [Purpureocillium lilacinum]|uniref:Uncharacterized protein n=1 Tax=Purpureocillium lilacinum TaxID=33203 RepID=A0ACC4DIA3_PURLI
MHRGPSTSPVAAAMTNAPCLPASGLGQGACLDPFAVPRRDGRDGPLARPLAGIVPQVSRSSIQADILVDEPKRDGEMQPSGWPRWIAVGECPQPPPESPPFRPQIGSVVSSVAALWRERPDQHQATALRTHGAQLQLTTSAQGGQCDGPGETVGQESL